MGFIRDKLIQLINNKAEQLEKYNARVKREIAERRQYQLGWEYGEEALHDIDYEECILFLHGLTRFHNAEQTGDFISGVKDFREWIIENKESQNETT